MHLFQGTENHFWGFVRDSKKGKLVYHTHIYAQSGGQIIPDEDWNWRKNQYFHSNVCFIFSRLEQTVSLCSITKQLPSTQQCYCVCVFQGWYFSTSCSLKDVQFSARLPSYATSYDSKNNRNLSLHLPIHTHYGIF